jgi:hypothetical protein
MTLPLLMVRSRQTLTPADDLAAEDMLHIKEGKPALVEVRHPRSLPQHRLLFKMIREVARSTPTPLSENALRQWLTVKTGHVDVMPLGFGRSYEAPRSWAFDKMDQAEFRQLFEDVVHLVLTEVAPNLPESFTDEFLRLLSSPDTREASKLSDGGGG